MNIISPTDNSGGLSPPVLALTSLSNTIVVMSKTFESINELVPRIKGTQVQFYGADQGTVPPLHNY